MNLRTSLLLLLLVCTGCMPADPIPRPSHSGPLPFASATGPLDDPKQVLDDAIQARGGEAVLKKLMNNYCTGEGQSIILNEPHRFRFKTHCSLPDRLRDESVYENGLHFLQVVSGGKGWSKEWNKDQTVVTELDAVNLRTTRETLYGNHLMTLVPLRDPKFKLTPLPEQRKDGYLCRAFSVQSDGHPDTTFFFDKDTRLPLVLRTKTLDPNTLVVKNQEIYFRDYQTTDGLKFPMRWVIYNDGNKAFELKFAEIKLLNSVEPQFFEKP